ncbi:hypothetical protein TSTA_054450 [Talaromyces stipitatus ATCC 10500]|uniref:Fe2OG dioxygenase domain-containing protein n=1 Tax=Talaromyces stipitatus (strain ATCC 10500 / CBS 375.48 / QM 6759 / NRRL 1006) TaxID=441959 RepID=B8MR38_TALSN|nr:uncharacterized protein TSTA_054450 [Talaromyces stipitatus ATCC 10500]EED12933.1 hypothetical protein TSTA_054450 [Talaromyces stipitatus ATCC 10500]
MPKRGKKQQGKNPKRRRSGQAPSQVTQSESASGSAEVQELEDVRGQPAVWANDRPSLCETLPWFQSHQGGVYQTEKVCHGFFLGGHGGPRDYIDDEIVITRVGGDCESNGNGAVTQMNDQSWNTRAVQSLRASQESGVAVGLIISKGNQPIKRKLPHELNVMGWFRVVEIWFENTNGKSGARVRFQKLDLEEPSWWAKRGSEDPPPISQRNLRLPESKICKGCLRSSKLVYEQGWMCLQPKSSCFLSGLLDDGTAPTDLTYDVNFLSSREPPDDHIKPQFSLVPNTLAELERFPDAWSQKFASRGVVCPECHKCIARRYWKGWMCHDPLDDNVITESAAPCQWKKILDVPTIPLKAVQEDLNVRSINKPVDKEWRTHIQQEAHSTDAYHRMTYIIGDVGKIVHFRANESILNKPKGPDDLFQRLQQADLGLYRYSINTRAGTRQLTKSFAANFGMPYKYVLSVRSKGFDEAPAEVILGLDRLKWATDQVAGKEASGPNELLALGYLEKMAMGFHDDGEDSLGPTIATLSLGANATMKFRLKDQYFRGSSRSHVLVADDAVLPGCENYEERKELKAQRNAGELTKDEYSKHRMRLAKAVTKNEGSSLITLDLRHGDMVVMHGSLLQKYYEHSVESKGKLRFALTSRHVKPEMVEEGDRVKGEYNPAPDQIYNGE